MKIVTIFLILFFCTINVFLVNSTEENRAYKLIDELNYQNIILEKKLKMMLKTYSMPKNIKLKINNILNQTLPKTKKQLNQLKEKLKSINNTKPTFYYLNYIKSVQKKLMLEVLLLLENLENLSNSKFSKKLNIRVRALDPKPLYFQSYY